MPRVKVYTLTDRGDEVVGEIVLEGRRLRAVPPDSPTLQHVLATPVQEPRTGQPLWADVTPERFLGNLKYAYRAYLRVGDVEDAGGESPQRYGKDPDLGDINERAALIASILDSLYGDDALAHLTDAEAGPRRHARGSSAWDALSHPRDQKTGRFVKKGSVDAVARAHAVVRDVVGKGARSGHSEKDVVEHLAILTVDQLRALAKEHGGKPGRMRRQELVDAVKGLLEGKETSGEEGAAPATESAPPVPRPPPPPDFTAMEQKELQRRAATDPAARNALFARLTAVPDGGGPSPLDRVVRAAARGQQNDVQEEVRSRTLAKLNAAVEKGQFDPERDLDKFAYRVANNELASYLRSRENRANAHASTGGGQGEIDVADTRSAEGGLAGLEAEETRAALAAAVGKLDPKHAQAIDLMVTRGMSSRKAAEYVTRTTGESISHTMMCERMRAGLAKLKAMLGGGGGSEGNDDDDERPARPDSRDRRQPEPRTTVGGSGGGVRGGGPGPLRGPGKATDAPAGKGPGAEGAARGGGGGGLSEKGAVAVDKAAAAGVSPSAQTAKEPDVKPTTQNHPEVQAILDGPHSHVRPEDQAVWLAAMNEAASTDQADLLAKIDALKWTQTRQYRGSDPAHRAAQARRSAYVDIYNRRLDKARPEAKKQRQAERKADAAATRKQQQEWQRAGKMPDGRQMAKPGDEVYLTAAGFGGLGTTVRGKVIERRDGTLAIQVAGGSDMLGIATVEVGKIIEWTPQWTVKDDPEIARRQQERQAKDRAEKEQREQEGNQRRSAEHASMRRSLDAGEVPLDPATVRPGDQITTHWSGEPRRMIVTEVDPNLGVFARDEGESEDEPGGSIGKPDTATMRPPARTAKEPDVKPATQNGPNRAQVEHDIVAANERMTDRHTGLSPYIPSIYDVVKAAHPTLTEAEFHAILHGMAKKDLLTMQSGGNTGLDRLVQVSGHALERFPRHPRGGYAGTIQTRRDALERTRQATETRDQ